MFYANHMTKLLAAFKFNSVIYIYPPLPQDNISVIIFYYLNFIFYLNQDYVVLKLHTIFYNISFIFDYLIKFYITEFV